MGSIPGERGRNRAKCGRGREQRKQKASPHVTGEAGPRIGIRRLPLPRTDTRGRTGSSPAHPFGNLATTGRPTEVSDAPTEGPWLCAPVFRRVCPFEDERRCDPGYGRGGLPPETATKTGTSRLLAQIVDRIPRYCKRTCAVGGDSASPAGWPAAVRRTTVRVGATCPAFPTGGVSPFPGRARCPPGSAAVECLDPFSRIGYTPIADGETGRFPAGWDSRKAHTPDAAITRSGEAACTGEPTSAGQRSR